MSNPSQKSDEGGAAIRVENLSKTFVLHVQGGTRLPVFSRLSLEVAAGECVALYGPSGSGKSPRSRSFYANYKPASGHAWFRHPANTGSNWIAMPGPPPPQDPQVSARPAGPATRRRDAG